MDLFEAYVESPVGLVVIRGNKDYVVEVGFVGDLPMVRVSSSDQHTPSLPRQSSVPMASREGNENLPEVLKMAVRQLEEYFVGKRLVFDFPMQIDGTSFQTEVWKALQEIPFGMTQSYGELAKKIGKPLASRAVGMANHRNKLGIVIPCHRVVGSNGKLVGYASGVDKKAWLLDWEKQVVSGQI